MGNVPGPNSARTSGEEAAPGCSGRQRGSAPADGDPVSFPPNVTAQLGARAGAHPAPGAHLTRQSPDVPAPPQALSHTRSAAPGKATLSVSTLQPIQDERVGHDGLVAPPPGLGNLLVINILIFPPRRLGAPSRLLPGRPEGAKVHNPSRICIRTFS